MVSIFLHLLSSTCLNLLGSNTAAVSQPITSRLDNCEWIEFSFNLFELFYSYCVLLYIFRLSYQGVTKKGM